MANPKHFRACQRANVFMEAVRRNKARNLLQAFALHDLDQLRREAPPPGVVIPGCSA